MSGPVHDQGPCRRRKSVCSVGKLHCQKCFPLKHRPALRLLSLSSAVRSVHRPVLVRARTCSTSLWDMVLGPCAPGPEGQRVPLLRHSHELSAFWGEAEQLQDLSGTARGTARSPSPPQQGGRGPGLQLQGLEWGSPAGHSLGVWNAHQHLKT